MERHKDCELLISLPFSRRRIGERNVENEGRGKELREKSFEIPSAWRLWSGTGLIKQSWLDWWRTIKQSPANFQSKAAQHVHISIVKQWIIKNGGKKKINNKGKWWRRMTVSERFGWVGTRICMRNGKKKRINGGIEWTRVVLGCTRWVDLQEVIAPRE